MNKSEADTIIKNFLDSPKSQDQVESVLNYCAVLCDAVAETHGFNDDERSAHEMLIHGSLDPATPTNKLHSMELPNWLEAQLLTAEFGRVMSECGEAIENVRKPGPDDKCPAYPGWHVEILDAIIRLFHMLGKRGIKPGEIFIAKTLVNNAREFKHGKNS